MTRSDPDHHAQGALSALPSLVTLNVTTYPFPIGTPASPYDNSYKPKSVLASAHHVLLRHLANVVLEHTLWYHNVHYHQGPPLRNVVFGIAEKGYTRTGVNDLKPAYFTRSDLWGWKRVQENMESIRFSLLEMEGEEVDVLLELVDERLDREEMLEWDLWL